MSRLFIYLHRYAGSIGGTVARKAFADNFMGQLMGNHIIKAQPYPFKYRRPRMDTDCVIIIQRGIVGHADFYYGINIAAFLDFAVGIGTIAHQRGPAEFKIAQMIGMVDDLGAVRIGVKGALLAAVPYQTAGFIYYLALVIVEYFRNEGLRLQFIPL